MFTKRRKNLSKTQIDSAKRLSLPREEIEVASISNIGRRSGQEDSFGVSNYHNKALVAEKGILALVADGMGGLDGGEEASWITASVFLEYFTKGTFEGSVPQELLSMVQQANRNVCDHIQKRGGMSGSTVVAVIIKDRTLHFVSVGDSRIYLLRNGGLLQLNREHIYAKQLDVCAAEGKISMQRASEDRERKSLTSYIGMGEIEEIDYNINPVELVAGDTILLMSDGVFGTVSHGEIIQAVAGQTPQAATERLQRAVLSHQKQSQDNFTAVCIAVQ